VKRLAGKKVLSLRAKGQMREVEEAIMSFGGIPISVPLLHIVPKATIDLSLATYDWVIFTSKNAVRCFFSSYTLPIHVRIAVVGEKTKLALEEMGYHASFMPSAYVGEVFAIEFSQVVKNSQRVLFPKGDRARDVISTTLRSQGVFVQDIIVYKTEINRHMRPALIQAVSEGVDVVLFTSPSTVQGFVTLLAGTEWKNWLKTCTIGCIGPVTKREALPYFKTVVMPNTYTIAALLQCIVEKEEKGVEEV
jgi:uroporphyrinogen-III synthase